MTIPVSVASAERSFSKLKLIKSYLRSSMSQERLSDLAIFSIERELVKSVDFESLVNDFVREEKLCFRISILVFIFFKHRFWSLQPKARL